MVVRPVAVAKSDVSPPSSSLTSGPPKKKSIAATLRPAATVRVTVAIMVRALGRKTHSTMSATEVLMSAVLLKEAYQV